MQLQNRLLYLAERRRNALLGMVKCCGDLLYNARDLGSLD